MLVIYFTSKFEERKLEVVCSDTAQIIEHVWIN